MSATISAKDLAAFARISELSVAEQARHFLRAFIADFTNGTHDIEEVLDLAAEFVSYTDSNDRSCCVELDEVQFHLFLERRDETMTIVAVRNKMKEIDLDSNNEISFTEYCLFKYEKTLGQLLAPEPAANDALLRQLNEAIAAYEAILAKRQAKLERIALLSSVRDTGGVKGMRASLQIHSLEAEDQLEQNRAEVNGAFKKRQAERALSRRGPMPPAARLDAPNALRGGGTLADEERKLASKKAGEASALALKRAESKKRLKARASAFRATPSG